MEEQIQTPLSDTPKKKRWWVWFIVAIIGVGAVLFLFPKEYYPSVENCIGFDQSVRAKTSLGSFTRRCYGRVIENGKKYPNHFNEKDIHPEVQAELGKEFTLRLGQIASFQEGFKVIFVGYYSGCGDGQSGLKDLILKRAEASQCPSGNFSYFAVIKNGVVYEGHREYYLQGFEIRSVRTEEDQSEVLIVTLMDPEKVIELQQEENDRLLNREAREENSVEKCLQIKNHEQKEYCVSSIARETLVVPLMQGNYTIPLESLIRTTREMCSQIGYLSGTGICPIVGETTVLKPEECLSMANTNEYGTGVSEDCFLVSFSYYGANPNICPQLKWESLQNSCRSSSEKVTSFKWGKL